MSKNTEPVPSWLFKQAAVIPCRKKNGNTEIMLITTRKKKRWIIPKGVIDPGTTAEESAVNEAWEEAGVRGRIVSDELGRFSYDKWGGTCTVRVFLFEVDTVLEKWPESDMRDRKWLSVEEAVECISEKKLKKIMRKALGKD